MTAITLPWPPTINTYWRRSAQGGTVRTHLTKQARTFREEVGWLVKQVDGFEDKRVAVTIVANPPDRRRRDLDNILKPILDALEHHGVFFDDSQVDALSISRGPVTTGGEVTVHIEAAENQDE